MRRLTSRPAPLWVARARENWRALRSRVTSRIGAMDPSERARVTAHAFAIAAVAGAVLIRAVLDTSSTEPTFWLFHVAIAVSAAYGGAAPALVATLASFVAARALSGVPLSAGLLFCVEGLLVAFVVLRLTKALQHQRRRLATLDEWVLELKSTERYGRLVDGAFTRLDEAAGDTVLILLDRTGHITDWRTGATRVYGIESKGLVGSSAAPLFGDLSPDDFDRLITEARRGAVRHTGHQRRGDGTTFDAEIEIAPLSRGGFDGFTMIVRDLTRQKAREAAASSTAEAYAELRAEADLAHRQLSMLQDVTDPSLNSLGGPEFVTTLLDRLRTAIGAEGIALVHMGRFRRRVFCASAGLQCQRGIQRPNVELRSDAARTLMIHNDPSGVAELSAAGWPDDVSSLIAVPVVRAGSRQAVMEVVNRTGRRATEWEIALVQVVAARIAGFLQDDPYADSGAVA